jgi:hypothetical protein
MTPPPTSIDGTDITGATIDGQDVQEITIDGQTVFTAGPVAQSNLLAWWRMGDDSGDALKDSATTTDFGDSTPYDFVEEGQSTNETNTLQNGGVTDIETGANSSAYDMIADGNLDSPLTNLTSPLTFMGWVNFDSLSGTKALFGDWNSGSSDFYIQHVTDNRLELNDDLAENISVVTTFQTGEYVHVAGVLNTTNRLYIDGVEEGASAGVSSGNYNSGDGFDVGSLNNSLQFTDAQFDDVRVYNRELTASEISSIFNATKP